MTGRPSEFNQATVDVICFRLADGESLRSICRDDDMPDRNTVFRWLRGNEAFRRQYASAREDQAETIFEEMLDIADDGSRDYDVDEDGKKFVDHDHIQRAKLRVETRKWILGKLAPKKFGEKIQTEHSGRIIQSIERTIVKP